MANKIQLKRSSTPSSIPSTGDLDAGELAVNTNDGFLFLKRGSDNAIVTFKPTGSDMSAFAAVSTSTGSTTTELTLAWNTPTIEDAPFSLNVNGTDVDILVDGLYLIMLTVSVLNAANRTELTGNIYLDTGAGFSSVMSASNYATRDANQDNGSVFVNHLVTLSSGDSVRATALSVVDGGTPTVTAAGTTLNIIKLETGGTGPAGPTGADGTSINVTSGSGAPNNSDGEPDGSIYIQTV